MLTDVWPLFGLVLRTPRPTLYGAAPDPRTTDVRPDRDDGEVALLRAAVAADLPVHRLTRPPESRVSTYGNCFPSRCPAA